MINASYRSLIRNLSLTLTRGCQGSRVICETTTDLKIRDKSCKVLVPILRSLIKLSLNRSILRDSSKIRAATRHLQSLRVWSLEALWRRAMEVTRWTRSSCTCNQTEAASIFLILWSRKIKGRALNQKINRREVLVWKNRWPMSLNQETIVHNKLKLLKVS